MYDRLRGIRVRILPMGCRTNLFESEALGCYFTEAGAILSEEEVFDAAVVVTCSVTSEADRKCRQILRRLRRENPDGMIIAAGCWAQRISPEEARDLGVDCLVGNRLKSRIPGIVAEMMEHGRPRGGTRLERVDVQKNPEWDHLRLSERRTRTRAFVKIQDGCDHKCTYCLIPDLRGMPVERDPGEILQEVSMLASSGCREVVFTGTNLGMFGRVSGFPLGEIVRRTGQVEGIERVRFGSLEPFWLTEDLLEALADTPQFCPHLHIPLQSGDTDILDRMGRGYTPGEFEALVERARNFLGEDLHLSTDIIVGFPGETDKAFRSTMEMLERISAGKVHVFPFSPREGTPASLIDGPVPAGVVRSRMDQALSLASELLERYSGRWVGKAVEILVEKSQGGVIEGHSGHFLRVRASGGALPGEITMVVPDDSKKGVLLGMV